MLNKKEIEIKISEGLTIEKIAEYFKVGSTTLRYWLKKYNLKTKNAVNRRSWSDDMLIEAVKTSISIRQIIIKLGLSPRPGNYPTIKKRIKELQLNTSHLLGCAHGGICKIPLDKTSLDGILIEHSSYSRHSIKKRIIKNKLLPYECFICKNKGLWNKENLVLVLDHINGVNDDYRINNLRFLCPNCNSQQDTFCGRKKKKYYPCIQCGTPKRHRSPGGLCMKCRGINDRKVERPISIELIKLLKDSNFSAVGRKYGVTDNAVRRWAKSYGILV